MPSGRYICDEGNGTKRSCVRVIGSARLADRQKTDLVDGRILGDHMADMKLEAWLTGGLNRLSRTIDNRDLVMREGKRRPNRSSIRTLNHLHINDGVGQIQISLPPPLPRHPTSTPTPVRPEIQTIHDGRRRDTNSQHDTEASRSPRPHGSSEVRCERCYHPQRGSTCAPD